MAVSVQELKDKFKELFGGDGDIHAYFAPGRVNLIGEHTDYNGGHVFPCALTIGTYGIIRPRADRKLRFYSVNFSGLGIIETSLDELVPEEAADWTNYPKGVMWTFEKRGYHLPTGADILIYGDIPAGSGLSSSASLEVLTGLMLRDTFGFDISMVDLALIGQYSENNFNGMNCGIMDQFASAMGKKDCAIFLDTATLEYEYAPIKLPDAKIVITNSKVKHSLVSSAYNDRRRECETALKELQAVVDIKTLGDLTEEQFEAHKDAIQDPVCRKRAKQAPGRPLQQRRSAGRRRLILPCPAKKKGCSSTRIWNTGPLWATGPCIPGWNSHGARPCPSWRSGGAWPAGTMSAGWSPPIAISWGENLSGKMARFPFCSPLKWCAQG